MAAYISRSLLCMLHCSEVVDNIKMHGKNVNKKSLILFGM
jgi:hypothetical protein